MITEEVTHSLHVDYKHSGIKQYPKGGRGSRTETTINDSRNFGIRKGRPKGHRNLPALREVGFPNETCFVADRRLLNVERVSHDCGIGEEAFQKVQRPAIVEGQRASGVPFGPSFGDLRVQALLHAVNDVADSQSRTSSAGGLFQSRPARTFRSTAGLRCQPTNPRTDDGGAGHHLRLTASPAPRSHRADSGHSPLSHDGRRSEDSALLHPNLWPDPEARSFAPFVRGRRAGERPPRPAPRKLVAAFQNLTGAINQCCQAANLAA